MISRFPRAYFAIYPSFRSATGRRRPLPPVLFLYRVLKHRVR